MNFLQRPLGKKGNKKTNESSSKIALGVALVILGLILVFGGDRVIGVLSKSFENEPVKIEFLSDQKFFSDQELKEDKIPKRILIPRLSIDLEVERSERVNGYWQVFEDKAGWGEGSGFPGEKGNQVIFAHAKKGLFLPLLSIKLGDFVYILTDSNWFRYEVKEIKEVYPNQVEVIAPTDDETLTLYTCSGFADSKRLVVIAKPF